MKALILAAGLGTRLKPYTDSLPKPLFTLNSRPVLDLAIERLVLCGCDKIFINTHHCPEQINAFVQNHRFKAMIEIVHEPEILDTGGAIANIQSRMDQAPFFVINSDVVSSIDLNQVYAFHLTSSALATLVVHDCPPFNKIQVDAQGFVEHFHAPSHKGLAFTGIQVLSPEIYGVFPKVRIFSSIEVYQALGPAKQVKAFQAENIFWQDIGTIFSYVHTSQQCLCAGIWNLAENQTGQVQILPLAGDGSDRKWFRARHHEKTLVLSDHGICLDPGESLAQLKAFVSIGNHLSAQHIPVPRILGHDALSGQVALEDLGDVHLASIVIESKKPELILNLYQQVIDHLIEFSQKGIQGFDPDWTCQTPSYSRELILEKECAYFMTAFVQNYLEKEVAFEPYAQEFAYIADNALEYGFQGLMHRDMQSKNIMVKDNKIYFIDFQSARIGPLQYDLASLLMDPYVTLSLELKKELVAYTLSRLGIESKVQRDRFERCYHFCCLTRNLQFLGAFAYLAKVKGKPWFEAYIPTALASLKRLLGQMDPSLPIKGLKALVTSL